MYTILSISSSIGARILQIVNSMDSTEMIQSESYPPPPDDIHWNCCTFHPTDLMTCSTCPALTSSIQLRVGLHSVPRLGIWDQCKAVTYFRK